MKEEIKNILTNSIKEGILLGIAIGLVYFFSDFQAHNLIFSTLVINIIFGSVVGYFIFVGESITALLLEKSSFAYRESLILLVLSSFLVSAGIFNLGARLFRLFIPAFMTGDQILYRSLGVGVISVIISVFYHALENRQLALKLEKENKKLAVVKERNRIARELHDSVSQNLFGANLQLSTLKKIIEKKPNEAKKIVGQLEETVQAVQQEMRLLIYE